MTQFMQLGKTAHNSSQLPNSMLGDLCTDKENQCWFSTKPRIPYWLKERWETINNFSGRHSDLTYCSSLYMKFISLWGVLLPGYSKNSTVTEMTEFKSFICSACQRILRPPYESCIIMTHCMLPGFPFHQLSCRKFSEYFCWCLFSHEVTIR